MPAEKNELDNQFDVMIVDDVPENLNLLEEILKKNNYNVRLATDAKIALRSIKAKQPSIILLDVELPGIDGFELCRLLKEDDSTKGIPVIFLTAHKSLQNIIKGFQLGGVDFISKPITFEEVLVRVNTHVTIRKLQYDAEQYNIILKKEIEGNKLAREKLEQSNELINSLFEKEKRNRKALLSMLHDQKETLDSLKISEAKIKNLNATLEQRVIERTSQLDASNKELEAFAYSVSHDLRAPLRAIDGFSRFLLEDYGSKLDSEGIRLLNIIQTNTKKMDQLIADMLSLSRITRSEFNYSRIDMNTLANSIYNEVTTDDIRQKFEFNVISLPDAFGDTNLIRQVWVNLISNAVKYTMKSETKRIEIGGKIDINNCIYYIKDTGAGFNPDFLHKLFGVFQRLHKSEEFEGTGIGLAIVQRIINRHSGKVWAEGKVNEGATFYFSLPVI